MKTITCSLLLVPFFLVAAFSSAGAWQEYLSSTSTNTDFLDTYPDTVNTKLNNCLLCHVSGGYSLNPYGRAYGNARHDFGSIESADSDGDGFINIDEITALTFPGDNSDYPLTPPNNPPVANAGDDRTVAVGSSVTLNGGGSTDADGDLLNFSWLFSSRPSGSTARLSNANTVSPTFVVNLAGTYVVQLVVNDGTVDSAPDTVTITTSNSAPVANAGPDQKVYVNDTVTLDGSKSGDVDGNTLTYEWLLTTPTGSGAALSDPNTVSPTFVVDLAGTYVAQLIVNDGTVDSAADTVFITTTENTAPVANAGPDQTVGVNAIARLNGSGSSDVDGDTLSFSWSFTSTPTERVPTLSNADTVSPTFVVDLAGTYVVQLIVNDGTLDSAPDTVTISTQNSPPVADAGRRQRARVGDTVTLDGSNSSDADGDPLTYSWSLTSTPTGSSAPLSARISESPTFTFDADLAGTYVVQLIVNDGTMDSAPDTCTVTVRAGGKPGKGGGGGKGNVK